MFDLGGKNALVTGATGGLGGAIARKLHARGARVALSGTRAEKLERLAAELGEHCTVTPCNLSDSDAVDSLVKRVSESLGGDIDILVSNAGLTRDRLLMRMRDDDWHMVQKVNLEAYFRLARACLRGMMKSRRGRIVGVTSVVGVTGNPGQANYAASKAGMIGFSKSLAQEVASRGVTVNCVAPGFIASPITDVLNDVQKKTILNKIPAGYLGTGDDVANAVLYLVSDEASYVTGQTLHVNGGMAMI
ncbi:MAG: 3-oxoacyl-[acyl-carrier-protein] reductase [Hyphomonadaceae bacterium]|nr:3-oxoacyl-[acyl-carrier-protein] reductase [Hyphomonadaceae bacterium]MBC6412117.1 3-oxoacyl-[acyl-carrier-protein] reductase [Hyphomonadaceae bacterium]